MRERNREYEREIKKTGRQERDKVSRLVISAVMFLLILERTLCKKVFALTHPMPDSASAKIQKHWTFAPTKDRSSLKAEKATPRLLCQIYTSSSCTIILVQDFRVPLESKVNPTGHATRGTGSLVTLSNFKSTVTEH